MKAPKILFFVDGMAPTPDDMAAAAEITGQICFRNARVIPAEGALEECDGVAGHIPAPYKKLPSAAQAIKAHAAKIKALAGKVGDSPAPVPPGADGTEPQGDQGAAPTGEPATDPANVLAPGAAPAGAAGAAWKSN